MINSIVSFYYLVAITVQCRRFSGTWEYVAMGMINV